MKICFYNNHNNGDIHYTREFIKDIMDLLPLNEYYFCHNRSKRLIMDLKIDQILNNPVLNNSSHINSSIFKIDDILYINTWVGQGNYKYIVKCRNSCSLYSFYELFNDIYSFLNIQIKDISYYIPDISYGIYDINNIDSFMENNYAHKILISNGDVKSGQSSNFDFNPIIYNIAEEYKNIQFILTDKKNQIVKDNIFYTGDIIKSDKDSDLNEISYISTFCDIIIGRSSGPYTFSVVKKNLLNSEKIFIGFTNLYDETIVYDESPSIKIWSNDYSYENVYHTIKNVIQKLISNNARN